MKLQLLPIAIISVLLLSCEKNVDISYPRATKRPISPVSINDTDTSQNIFAISVLNHPSSGRIYISPTVFGDNTKGNIMVLNQSGHVLKQKAFSNLAGNFRVWNINGKIRYSFEMYDLTAIAMTGVGYWPGYEIITDTNFNEISRVRLLSFGSINAKSDDRIDGHDFILLDDGHYIVQTYIKKIVTNIPTSLDSLGPMKVVACVIQEISNGIVVWQWDATDYPELYSTSLEGNKFNDSTKIFDYAHLNSIFLDPRDNNLICSFRNLDQVIKIERGTGKILWRLGGVNSDFNLTSDQVFLRQHDVTLTDDNNTLLIFDDGEMNSRTYSRIVEFNLNESNKSVLGFKSFNIPEPPTYIMGSVQKRGNTYFIGGGSAGYVLEVNYLTGEKILELKSSEFFYRAYKF